MATDSLWMTQASLDRLKNELAELEHAGQDADQARIGELRDLIRRAQVDTKPDDGLVEPGMRVEVRFERDGSTLDFVLGSREMTDLDPDLDIDVYSPTSPLGAAIAGSKVGDSVTYAAPTGEQSVTILSAHPFA